MSGFTIRAPSTSSPSSVRVPVLSKQTTSSLPPTLTLGHLALGLEDGKSSYFCGLMQKIFCFFNRESAKFVPIVNVAGKAGGTTIVIKSRALTMMNFQESCKS